MTLYKVFAASAILIVVAFTQISCIRPTSETLEVGSAAPNFKLRSLEGKEVSLDQFKGKVVLLDFWQTSCGPCRITMPLLERLQKEFPKSMILLAINLQEPASVVRDYVREQDIHSEVLLDEDGSVASSYDVAAIPTQVLLDKEAKLRRVWVGLGASTISQLRAEIQRLQ